MENDKIIKIHFDEWQKTQYIQDALTQWSYGQILQIEGLQLPEGKIEVHFSLTEYDGDAPVFIGTIKDNVITVEIPDFILEKEKTYLPSYEAYAWVYMADEKQGQTIREIVFTVKSRAKPTTNVPDDQKDMFLKEVREVMAQTEEIAQSVRNDANEGKFNGKDGDKGDNGKSAYEYAKEGGFEGTEQEFADLMAKAGQVDLTGYVTKEEHEAELLKAMVKVTTEESTFHHITDSANMKVVDFGMEGNTEQESTEGKNLYSGGDVSGTGFVLITDITPIPSGTYTISAKVKSSDTDTPNDSLVAFLDSDGNITYVHMLPNNDNRWAGTITLISERNSLRFYASNNAANSTGDTFSCTDIQIEPGEVMTDYEPYTNGPSPNPDYPQEIVNAGVTNLFDVSKIDNTVSTNNADFLVTNDIYGKTVTLSANVVNTAGIVCLRGFESSEDTSGVELITLKGTQGTGRISKTATISTEYHHYAVRVYSYASWNLTDIQLELGSVATPYKPYGKYGILYTICNKNWHTIRDVSGTRSKIVKLDNIIPAGTYTFSANVESSDTDNVKSLILCRYANGSSVGITITRGTKQSQKVTFADNVYSMTFYASSNNDYSVDDTFSYTDIQIELGDTTTDFVEPQSQQINLTSPVPLTKWDYLTKRDGVWGWSIWSSSGIFDGSSDEIWTRQSSSDEVRSIMRIPTLTDKLAGKTNILCSHFWNYSLVYPTGNIWHQTEMYNAFSGTNSANLAYFNVSPEFTTVDKWRTWLAENPITLVWETSAEQAFHPLPDNEQTLLNNLETYYGITNMYNDQGCPMWIKYVADTKIYVDNQILAIKEAIV